MADDEVNDDEVDDVDDASTTIEVDVEVDVGVDVEVYLHLRGIQERMAESSLRVTDVLVGSQGSTPGSTRRRRSGRYLGMRGGRGGVDRGMMW